MKQTYVIIATTCLFALVTAQNIPYRPWINEMRPPMHNDFPPYFYPMEHRNDLQAKKENLPDDAYDYSVIPRNEYYHLAKLDTPVAPTLETSIVNCISTVINVVKAVISAVGSIVLSILPKLGLVALGSALFFGFCTFTPFCTLTIEEPLSSELSSLSPYLDYVEKAVNVALDKYKEVV